MTIKYRYEGEKVEEWGKRQEERGNPGKKRKVNGSAGHKEMRKE